MKLFFKRKKIEESQAAAVTCRINKNYVTLYSCVNNLKI